MLCEGTFDLWGHPHQHLKAGITSIKSIKTLLEQLELALL